MSKIPETSATPLYPETSFTHNPLMHLRALFVRFVQGLFAQAPPGAYHWSPDDELTELYVSGEGEISPMVLERKPGVSFIRGPMQFHSVGIDDRLSYDAALDQKTKAALLPGTMTINGIARTDLESEHIAFIIAEHIWLLCDLIKKMGVYDIGRGIQIGAPSKAGNIIADDRGNEFYATPISVPFQLSRMSSFTPLGRTIIQSISQRLQLVNARPVNSLGAATHGHEFPVSVQYSFPPSFAPEAGDVPTPAAYMQPHPLNPSQMVCVRVLRPNRSGGSLHNSRAAIPISQSCVEQSIAQAPVFTQKG